MTSKEIEAAVLDTIAEIAPDEDLAGLDPETALREQIDLDSMDFLDMGLELRKRHKIEVPKEDYPKLESLDSCVSYLAPMFTATVAP